MVLLNKQSIIKEFEETLLMAELKALSNKSLEEPLSKKEFNRMMELKNILFLSQ
jgi:hypothetical protein